ncbi:ParB/RepB/Spo0J family partition protein [Patescibacteria group bacterium]|nr:ParB/RepB/Spo0J family partition protein [Patescibacteria group bacterium]MDE1946457.1 ParB/RepB/Spo0J family partition protein [Patescibacteria group bacterium]MDE2011064.1 ParB/RepB/Spo0J family partition protein [Patescibacteria group bacterium]
MIKRHQTEFKELPISQLELDDNQPRKEYGTPLEQEKLSNSIQQFGLQEPIMVTKKEDNRYVIIDGHRRYLCCKDLGIERAMCQVYPNLDDGELEVRRYEKQNNRKSWRPLEKSNCLHRAKVKLGIKNEELASLLNLSKSTIASSLQLREQKLEYLELMQEYKLKEVYRMEFLRLQPKLRKVRNFEVPDIIKILFEKVSNKVIRSGKDFRKLQKVFMRAAANEAEICKFLSDPDATVAELDRDTIQSGFSLHVLQLIEEIKQKRKSGIPFDEKENGLINELKKLL